MGRLTAIIAAVSCVFLSSVCAAEDKPGSQVMNFESGWRITQDVHDLGEKLRWFDPTNSSGRGGAPNPADWQEIPRLAHLQLLLAPQPYFGRELRYFNDAPWWYRLDFATPCRGAKRSIEIRRRRLLRQGLAETDPCLGNTRGTRSRSNSKWENY